MRMLQLANRITRMFGWYFDIEHEVQRMDHQRDFITWNSGYSNREDAEKACREESMLAPQIFHDYPCVFRVQTTFTLKRYPLVTNYRGLHARECDRVKESDRLR